MKNILFVVDERCMGGVSVLLTDMFKLFNPKEANIDLLVLHDRGQMFENLPENVHMIFGTDYFDCVDLSLKEVLHSKNLKSIYHKFRIVFEMKTGLIENRIKKERKKILNKHYDYEIAFKDGFTALFTIFGDSDIKYHWIQYNYGKGNPNAKYDKLFKRILCKFDKIIAVSDGIFTDFNKIYHLNDKTEIIYNYIDSERIKKSSEEKCEIICDKNKLNILCVGRLTNQHKGFDRLIEVVNRLNEEGLFDNSILRIIGDGVDYIQLQNQINSFNLENKVILLGSKANPYKYFKGQDLFILPSRFEAFGLVVVESLILHVPVLVTSNDATDKIVDDKKNGLIVENSSEGLYNGLKYLLSNRDILNEYKNNLEEYDYNNVETVKKIQQLFYR